MVSTALATIAAALSAAAAATAQTTATWSCRGSAVEVQVATNDRLAPILTERTPCADSSTGLPRTAEAVGLAPSLKAETAYARTSAQVPTAFPKDQLVAAEAGVEGLELKLMDGALTIAVDAARSAAGGSCAAGVPQFAGTSTVAGLRINDEAVVLDGLLSSIVDPISASPLGAIVQVKLNEQITNASGIIQRAAHVIVLPGAAGGAPLADVVIAESLVGSSSACDPTATNNNPPPGTTPVNDGSDTNGENFPRVCPAGSSLDRDRGLCVISAAASQGQGIVVVGRPFSGPSGGRVVSLTRARKAFKSPCLRGRGPKFAIIGTNKRDRITGTNRADRILSLGGSDIVSGGRGDDCIDGGTGGDNLSGSIGKDRIYGMSGKDHLNGGPGTDRLSGGTGNDTINAAFGQDLVFGGSGRDFINVATAGKPAKVSCGSGPDKVRINRNEQRRVRGCEIVFVIR